MHSRVYHQLLVKSLLTNSYIPDRYPFNFLSHFFNIMTELIPAFINKIQFLSLQSRIEGSYLQKLENKAGTLADL